MSLLALLLVVQDAPVSFEREVLPLLEKRCNACHHPGEMRGGLDLTRLATMRRGGDEHGAAVVPGTPDASPLVRLLSAGPDDRMPQNADPLPASEVELLRRWIAQGAKDDTPVFPAEDVAFFEREIRPVLAGRCFKCHAGEEPEHGLRLTSRHGILAGGERGPAAAAGRPDESLLLKAIRHDGELKMPRGGDRLSDAQVAAFAAWIAKGLPWPSHEAVLAREKRFTISEADRKHWAFRPLPMEAPSVDAILDGHRRRLGLGAAPEADRYRLLRRLSYDLTGFPPTPDEIAAFVNDPSPDAYEKQVERLLASPRFGRRWGRHWLDYTRNGANGQSNRGPALDADRYAAWVERCFNEDRPWDWFARVHLAGDLMPAFEGGDYSVDQAAAAAVPLNGPRTFETIWTETFVLMDKLDEGVEFLGRSLMGISLECARCHDHKFDPVSQREYYALLGFFQSSGWAPVPERATSRAAAEEALAAHRVDVRERARLQGYIRRGGQALSAQGGGRIKRWQESRGPVLAPVDRRLREIEVEIIAAHVGAAGNGPAAEALRELFAERQARLKAYAPPDFMAGGGEILGKYSYVIGGHKSTKGLIPQALALGRKDLAEELEAQDRFWKEERGRWGERKQFGGFERTDPEAADLVRAAERLRELDGRIADQPDRPYVALKAGWRFVRTDGGLRREEDLAPLDRQAKADGLHFNANSPYRALVHEPYVGDARLLARGDVLYPREKIPRGVPAFFGRLSSPVEGSGRLQLAGWLTEPGSLQGALVARAAANRAWQHLFGEALCRTPKELGRLGEAPEMPELVDALAARFAGGGWSMKRLVREIVTSRAYRRSALGDATRDPDNRWFARQSVRRIEFEAVLNAMEALTGRRPGAADYGRHFDAPSVYEILDRRVASISATQALFLMNNASVARPAASALAEENVERLWLRVLQRPPTDAERDLARGVPHPRDLVLVLLCGNEFLYIE